MAANAVFSFVFTTINSCLKKTLGITIDSANIAASWRAPSTLQHLNSPGRHRHSLSVSAAETELMMADSAKSGWKFRGTAKDRLVRVYVRASRILLNGLPAFREECFIENVGLQEVIAAICNVDIRKFLDPTIKFTTMVERLSNTDSLYLTLRHFNINGRIEIREFGTVESCHFHDNDQATIVATSVDDSKTTSDSTHAHGFTRGQLNIGGWIIKQFATGVVVVHIEDIKLHGDNIPVASQINLSQLSTPLTNLIEYLETKKLPPFLLQDFSTEFHASSSIKVQQERYISNGNFYSLRSNIVWDQPETSNSSIKSSPSPNNNNTTFNAKATLYLAIPNTPEFQHGISIEYSLSPWYTTANFKIIEKQSSATLSSILSENVQFVIMIKLVANRRALAADISAERESKMFPDGFIGWVKSKLGFKVENVASKVAGHLRLNMRPLNEEERRNRYRRGSILVKNIDTRQGYILRRNVFQDDFDSSGSKLRMGISGVTPPQIPQDTITMVNNMIPLAAEDETANIRNPPSTGFRTAHQPKTFRSNQPTKQFSEINTNEKIYHNVIPIRQAQRGHENLQLIQNRCRGATAVPKTKRSQATDFPPALQAAMEVVDGVWDCSVETTAYVIVGGVKLFKKLFWR
ncbi:hypothetical protein HDU76_009641 [Blyttiomyces sp. JEL0837]|nr:hypothetical protein HDU76_009641 [Blyttiomyces sp. JEL0837]